MTAYASVQRADSSTREPTRIVVVDPLAGIRRHTMSTLEELGLVPVAPDDGRDGDARIVFVDADALKWGEVVERWLDTDRPVVCTALAPDSRRTAELVSVARGPCSVLARPYSPADLAEALDAVGVAAASTGGMSRRRGVADDVPLLDEPPRRGPLPGPVIDVEDAFEEHFPPEVVAQAATATHSPRRLRWTWSARRGAQAGDDLAAVGDSAPDEPFRALAELVARHAPGWAEIEPFPVRADVVEAFLRSRLREEAVSGEAQAIPQAPGDDARDGDPAPSRPLAADGAAAGRTASDRTEDG